MVMSLHHICKKVSINKIVVGDGYLFTYSFIFLHLLSYSALVVHRKLEVQYVHLAELVSRGTAGFEQGEGGRVACHCCHVLPGYVHTYLPLPTTLLSL